MVEVMDKLNTFQLLIPILLPVVFFYLWTLIFGDFKNFVNSRKAYTVFSAKDPVNCYQNYSEKQFE